MSTYELDDELVREYKLTGRVDPVLSRALGDQLPPATPTGFGAVLVNEHGARLVHARPSDDNPWWNNSAKCWTRFTGNLVEVLSEGVDLP